MRIAIIAPTGMLGSTLYGVLRKNHSLVLVYRDESKLMLLDRIYGGLADAAQVPFDIADVQKDFLSGFPTGATAPSMKRLIAAIGEVDAVVNCAGIIKQHVVKDPLTTLFVNGAFPHLLSGPYGKKLIQITTDCAFSGIEGAPYTEESPKTPNDLYGLSKSIGEPADQSLVLRTSIIGTELHSFISLVEWVKQHRGKTIKGFTRHSWNGITAKQFGHIVDEIVSRRAAYPAAGLFHIFGTDVTKYDMVTAINKKFRVGATVVPDDGPFLDRRLRTVRDVNEKLRIPSFEQMLAEL